jgi:hypothetical protein
VAQGLLAGFDVQQGQSAGIASGALALGIQHQQHIARLHGLPFHNLALHQHPC